MKTTLIIPAYNASKVVDEVLDRIPAGVVDEILAVDDGSRDNTFEVLQRRPDVIALRNETNQGYGGTVMRLNHEALARGADILVLMHADGGHAPEDLPHIVAPILDDSADVCIGSRMEWLYNHSPRILGSRWLGAALRGNMPTARFVGTEFTTLVQNFILGTRYNVFHSGFRAMTREALLALDFESFDRGYTFDTEVLIAAHYAGMRIAAVPAAVFYDERAGSAAEPISYALKVIGQTYRLKQLYNGARRRQQRPHTT
jgi:glycosyltransferase involved in cell wall biosynthesis